MNEQMKLTFDGQVRGELEHKVETAIKRLQALGGNGRDMRGDRMFDREKVIKGLECCMVGDGHSPKCEICPYATIGDDTCQTMDALFGDALALLKAQEPRLVTESDFDGADEYGYIPVWTEEKDGDMYCECILRVAIPDPDDIGVVGYWTSRPTDEQREAVKWDG